MGIRERREREKEERRLHIIDAAEKVFFSKGYSDATMDQIAQEAELSRGTLYLYFKGKDAVHREIVSRGMNMLYDLISARIGEASMGMDRLAIIWSTFIRFSKEHTDYFDAFMHYETKEIDISSEKEMENWLNRYKVIGLTVRSIREGILDGSIRPDIDPSTLALLFWTQVTGAIQLIRFKGALIKNLLKIQPDEFLEHFRKFVFEHIRLQGQHQLKEA